MGEGHLGGVFSRNDFDLAFINSTPAMVCLLIGFHVVVLLPLIFDFGSNSNVSCSALDSSDKTSRRFRKFKDILHKINSKQFIMWSYDCIKLSLGRRTRPFAFSWLPFKSSFAICNSAVELSRLETVSLCFVSIKPDLKTSFTARKFYYRTSIRPKLTFACW